MTTQMNRSMLLMIITATAMTWGCSDPVKQKDAKPFEVKNNAPNADMTEDLVEKDMPTEDMPVVDMPKPVVRKLITHQVFGDMPLDNRFKDPMFTALGRSYDWLVRDPRSNQFSWLTHYRKEIWDSPTKMPVLKVPKDDGNRVEVFGTFHLSRSAAEVSVWLGQQRGSVLNGDDAWPVVTVYGFDVSNIGNFQGSTLEYKEGTEVKYGEITWRQYRAVISNHVGYAYLSILDTSISPLYVQSPTAATMKISPQALTTWSPALPKRVKVGAATRSALNELMRLQRTPRREQLMPKPVRVEPLAR